MSGRQSPSTVAASRVLEINRNVSGLLSEFCCAFQVCFSADGRVCVAAIGGEAWFVQLDHVDGDAKWERMSLPKEYVGDGDLKWFADAGRGSDLLAWNGVKLLSLDGVARRNVRVMTPSAECRDPLSVATLMAGGWAVGEGGAVTIDIDKGTTTMVLESRLLAAAKSGRVGEMIAVEQERGDLLKSQCKLVCFARDGRRRWEVPAGGVAALASRQDALYACSKWSVFNVSEDTGSMRKVWDGRIEWPTIAAACRGAVVVSDSHVIHVGDNSRSVHLPGLLPEGVLHAKLIGSPNGSMLAVCYMVDGDWKGREWDVRPTTERVAVVRFVE